MSCVELKELKFGGFSHLKFQFFRGGPPDPPFILAYQCKIPSGAPVQGQDDRSQPSEGWGGGSVKTNGLEKTLKLEADDSERQTDRFPCLCSVSAYFSACDRP